MSRRRAAVELLLLLIGSEVFAFAARILFSRVPMSDPRWYSVLGTASVGTLLIVACFVMMRIAGHKPISIGWTREDLALNIAIGLGALVATYIVFFSSIFAATFVFPELLTETPAAQEAIEKNFPPMRLYWVLPLTILVAFWEEIVFRGFLLTRLNAIFRRWWLTIVLASAMFGAIHVYEGLLAVVIISSLALVMGTLFVWRRSLVPSIVLHFLHNLCIFVLLDTISQTWE